GSYRWVTLENRRLCIGFVNPPDVEAADHINEMVLESAPYYLSCGPLDCEASDVLFAFDFLYTGNHDEVVAEAMGMDTTLEKILPIPGPRVLNYEPSLMLSLEETCRLQCRLTIDTRTKYYQNRTAQYPDAPISVNFTMRQYWRRQPYKTFLESSQNQRKICQD